MMGMNVTSTLPGTHESAQLSQATPFTGNVPGPTERTV
jgi:hypothetical protein